MTAKQWVRYDLVKSILLALLLPGFTFWFLVLDPNFINPLKKNIEFVRQKKLQTNGIITNAEKEEDYLEHYDSRVITKIHGYAYDYTFYTNKGKKINSKVFEYGDLPDNKEINEIPFNVKIQYLENDPKNNKIVGVPYRNMTLWDIFRTELLFPFILILLFSFIAFKMIEKAIFKYKQDCKY